jgi:hypothetical protein
MTVGFILRIAGYHAAVRASLKFESSFRRRAYARDLGAWSLHIYMFLVHPLSSFGRCSLRSPQYSLLPVLPLKQPSSLQTSITTNGSPKEQTTLGIDQPLTIATVVRPTLSLVVACDQMASTGVYMRISLNCDSHASRLLLTLTAQAFAILYFVVAIELSACRHTGHRKASHSFWERLKIEYGLQDSGRIVLEHRMMSALVIALYTGQSSYQNSA